MTDPNNDPTVSGGGNPPPAGYSQPNGYQQPSGYDQPSGYQQQSAYQQPGNQQPGNQQQGGYGQQPTAYAAGGYGTPAPPKTLSLISMIAGIVGVVAVGGFVPASIAALILGYMGKRREGAQAKGFWLTGIITGWVGVVFTLLILAFVIIFAIIAASAGESISTYNY